jgi:hypothetical protein
MRILVFDPYSDVWVHSFPTALVGEALLSDENEVHVVRCNGCLNRFCIAMSARGLWPDASRHERAVACRSCQRRREVLSSGFDFVEHNIDDLVGSDDLRKIQELVRSVTRENWHDFELDGLRLGRLAAYEFFLTYKLNSLEIPQALWSTYINFLTNSLLTHFAINLLLNRETFDAILVYNGLYSTNRIVTMNGLRRGIPGWALHAGSHIIDKFSTIAMYDCNILPVLAFKSEKWSSERTRPLSLESIRKVERHIDELLKGRNVFVYSSAADQATASEIRDKFRISADKKVLLATLSSGDEIIAARLSGLFSDDQPKDALFADAVEWVRFLVDEMKSRPDLHLLIRVHPREFPNKREGQRSQNSFLLEQIFQDLPNNVNVNWPDDNISLYDLIGVADVVLNSTSSAGLEFSAMGLPVVLHDTHFMLSYDPEINRVVRSRSEYMTTIDEALREGWSIENARKAFRWWAFVFGSLAIPIDDGFSYPSNGYTSTNKSLRAALMNWALHVAVRIAPPIRERRDVKRRVSLRHAIVFNKTISDSLPFAFADTIEPVLTLDEERDAISRSLGTLLTSISNGPDNLLENLKLAAMSDQD